MGMTQYHPVKGRRKGHTKFRYQILELFQYKTYSLPPKQRKSSIFSDAALVGEGGFEPPKALPADLQSVPFGHSGIPPYSFGSRGAGGRTRTPDLLITNQLLYRLSYTSISDRLDNNSKLTPFCQHPILQISNNYFVPIWINCSH